ncbi:MAG: ABC transporter permease [Bacilli bacterium]
MRKTSLILVYGPLLVFLALFALVPIIGVISSSVWARGITGEFFAQSLSGQYLNAFLTTLKVAFWSGLAGLAGGGLAALSLWRTRWRWLTTTLSALSGVLANFAGLPLAVAFMVTLGASGLVTNALQTFLHINLSQMGFNLSSSAGLILVYSAFQVPLALLVSLPAFSSIPDDLEGAALSLGCGVPGYLWRVLLPILAPSLLGTFALLFANAFSAYVTAYAIAGGSINLIPIQIGYLIDGNVSLNIGLGNALAVEEMVVLGASLWVFALSIRLRGRRRAKVKGGLTIV